MFQECVNLVGTSRAMTMKEQRLGQTFLRLRLILIAMGPSPAMTQKECRPNAKRAGGTHDHRPVNRGGRFSMKAVRPSL